MYVKKGKNRLDHVRERDKMRLERDELRRKKRLVRRQKQSSRDEM